MPFTEASSRNPSHYQVQQPLQLHTHAGSFLPWSSAMLPGLAPLQPVSPNLMRGMVLTLY